MLVSDILSDVKAVIGQCSDATAFAKLTDAIVVLCNKGNYDLHVGYVDICATSDGKTITLPRDIDTPLAVNVNGAPAYFRNKWFEFHMNGAGSFAEVPYAWDDKGDVPTFMDIIVASKLIAVADLKTDLAATIRIFGYDKNGNWIRTQSPDGTWTDGFLVPINLITDFPSGIITPDTERLFTRNFKTGKIDRLTASSEHQFVDGEFATLSLLVAPLPAPLVNGTGYYLRKLSDTEISLHATRSGALTNTGGIVITSAASSSSVSLTDRRKISVLTKFNSATAHNMKTGMKVSFTAGTLPTPVETGVDYFARVLDDNHFTIHETEDEAESNTNPIDCTTPGATIVASAKQEIKPITHLDFTVNHNFLQGDAVTIQNNTGTFPAPLLPNVTYYVRYINNKRITLHPTLADATNGTNAVVITSPGSGTSTVIKTMPCSVSLGTTNNVTCVGHNLSLSGGDFVQFTTTGTYPNPIAQNTTYRADTPSSADTFSLRTTAPAAVDILTLGTGQLFLVISRAFSIGFTGQWETDATDLATGTAIKFNTTGALPACSPAIDTSTIYYLRKISDKVVEIFQTSAQASDSAVRVTATRARSSNTATIVTNAAHGWSTNDFVDVNGVAATLNGVLATVTVGGGGSGYTNGETVTITDGTSHTAQGTIAVTAGAITAVTVTQGGNGFTVSGALTVTGQSSGANNATCTVATVTNGVDNLNNSYNGNRKQITVTNSTTFTYSASGLNEPTTTDTGGTITRSNIKATGFGAGTLSIVLDRTVTVVPFSSVLAISSSEYLQDLATIRFETDGTLPAPLALATDYRLSIVNGGLQVKDTLNNNITLTNIGSGSHNMTIVRNFGVTLPTYLEVVNNVYDDGDKVTLATTGTLPAGLSLNTDYYIRRKSNDTIELYPTKSQAQNTASTSGRIVPTNTGTGTHSMIQVLTNFEVSRITRVSKSATNGFLKLYAWDTGRTDALTLIGNYYPDETEPIYRRIKIGTPCAWVRMRYRKRIFKIVSSQDFIPLKSKQAILLALRSLQLYNTEFSEDAEKMMDAAERFMNDEQQSSDGADVVAIQFNQDIWTNPDDQNMM